jgi:hypothetical protein
MRVMPHRWGQRQGCGVGPLRRRCDKKSASGIRLYCNVISISMTVVVILMRRRMMVAVIVERMRVAVVIVAVIGVRMMVAVIVVRMQMIVCVRLDRAVAVSTRAV